MNKKVLGVVIASVVILVGGAFALKGNSSSNLAVGGGAIEITHELGTATFEKMPEKVVVLDYGMVDVLDGLGVEVTALPKAGKIPEYLNKYAADQYVDAGSVKEPNLEVINEIDPDVIIITGRMVDYYDQLSQIAPTVFARTNTSEYLKDFTENVTMMGDIFNQKDEANEMIKYITEKMAETKKDVETKGLKAMTVMVVGRGISVFGADSRFGIIYNDLGFGITDAELDVASHGQDVTFEYLAEKNPELLFVVDRNSISGGEEVTAQEVMENELVKQTDAYKNDKITYLNAVNWYTVASGYQSTLSMIDEVNNAIK